MDVLLFTIFSNEKLIKDVRLRIAVYSLDYLANGFRSVVCYAGANKDQVILQTAKIRKE